MHTDFLDACMLSLPRDDYVMCQILFIYCFGYGKTGCFQDHQPCGDLNSTVLIFSIFLMLSLSIMTLDSDSSDVSENFSSLWTVILMFTLSTCTRFLESVQKWKMS